MRYAAEYNGLEFHSETADVKYDEDRLGWIQDHRAWSIDPFTKDDVYAREADPIPRLQAGHAQARRSVSLWTPRLR